MGRPYRLASAEPPKDTAYSQGIEFTIPGGVVYRCD